MLKEVVEHRIWRHLLVQELDDRDPRDTRGDDLAGARRGGLGLGVVDDDGCDGQPSGAGGLHGRQGVGDRA